MARYLITGRGGSGKSTVCLELQRRGLTAYDTDKVPGLCRWENRYTGESIDVDPSGYVDFTTVAWAWQDEILRKLFREYDDLMLCGSSSNQEAYYSQFDKIFVLMLDPDTHLHRLKMRDFDYGKDPKLQRELIDGHQKFATELVKNGAIPIGAIQHLEKTVDDILRHVNHDN